MIRYLFIYLILFLSLFFDAVDAQELIYNKSVTGICFAGTKTTKLYIPPPEKFLKHEASKRGGSITVYYNGYTVQASEAFEYAVSILEASLPAGTKTTILANWEKIETAGVLGNSSVTAVVGGWSIDALNPIALYPVSLAEKIAGKSLNSDSGGDITLTLNSTVNWYMGTDGKVPVGKYDLVTVVLHELCHGLGFFDSMNADSNYGWYGISSFPVIYDTFIENQEERVLIDTMLFSNYSPGLLKEYTSGKLYFKGPVLRALTQETRVKIYAPSTWNNGSSISHLDEDFSADPKYRLMTPFIDMQEAIHDPGIFTMAILGDLGWINTRIIHNPAGDTEDNLTEINLSVEIQSDTTFNRDKVAVVYSYDGFSNNDTLYMASPGADNHFTATINIPSYNTEVQYYFFTEDFFLRTFHSPSLYRLFRYKSFIGSDTVKPEIVHSPSEYYFKNADSVRLRAEVYDNIGIDTVYVEYWLNENQKSYAGFKPDSTNSFSVALAVEDLMWNDGDSLKYRIFVKDSAKIENLSVAPDSGYFSVAVIEIGPVVTSYATDFANADADFFMSGFEIKRQIGFQNPGLHSRHPYASPEKDGASLNFYAILKRPVKFDNNGMLFQYNDIALVEPGETGAYFGSEDFYDYVVVEGSKDFGNTWSSLFDGYDAGYNSLWLKTYNSSIVDQSSTATGKESMFLQHTELVSASEVFQADDTVIIRFRLYSDPYANGWGWAIQDLKINPLIDGIEKQLYKDITVYPNPGKGIIRLNDESGILSDGKPQRYEIYNSSGILISNGLTTGPDTLIDISGSTSGFYIIVLYLENGIRTIKYNLLR